MNGGAGGSGFAIIRRLGNFTAASTTGSPARQVLNGYTYYVFKADGSITL
jgi:hypothetical protein